MLNNIPYHKAEAKNSSQIDKILHNELTPRDGSSGSGGSAGIPSDSGLGNGSPNIVHHEGCPAAGVAAAAVNAEPGSDGSGGAGGEGGGNSCPGRWACKRMGEHHRLLSVVRWVDYLISIALVACPLNCPYVFTHDACPTTTYA